MTAPRVALIGPEIEENLSLRYLSSSLSAAGYRAHILAFNTPQALAACVAGVLAEPTLLVGISLAFQWRATDFLAFAMALREAGYTGHITAGGHFATFECESILREFPELDSVVRQEGEGTVVALANALRDGSPWSDLPGLAHSQGVNCAAALPVLDELPWPDRSGAAAHCFGHHIAPLVSSRGCYANCTFCCIAAWHEQSLPGRRYRLRDLDLVADEMAAEHHGRGIEIFVFHDDNFFVPSANKNLERIQGLAARLADRGVHRYATVVKARPTDVREDVFRALKQDLNCIRCYIGVETDSEQGLKTLGRWTRSRQNHAALEVAERLDLYVCFNMLLFDPDTTLESLRTNVAFMADAGPSPFNFCRTELYAGTPLLQRMKLEGRVRGDWLQWDYDLGSPDVERVFKLAMACFRPRNFGERALANNIMGTRFDMEVARHFHPELFESAWLAEGKRLSGELARDTAAGLTLILDHVEAGGRDDKALVRSLSASLRATEQRIWGESIALARRVQSAVGGQPLTVLGDRVATPLQQPDRLEVTL